MTEFDNFKKEVRFEYIKNFFKKIKNGILEFLKHEVFLPTMVTFFGIVFPIGIISYYTTDTSGRKIRNFLEEETTKIQLDYITFEHGTTKYNYKFNIISNKNGYEEKYVLKYKPYDSFYIIEINLQHKKIDGVIFPGNMFYEDILNILGDNVREEDKYMFKNIDEF